jgi:hypothetical protein
MQGAVDASKTCTTGACYTVPGAKQPLGTRSNVSPYEPQFHAVDRGMFVSQHYRSLVKSTGLSFDCCQRSIGRTHLGSSPYHTMCESKQCSTCSQMSSPSRNLASPIDAHESGC